MSIKFCTLANYKTVSGKTDTANDSAVTLFIESVSKRFEMYCGRSFAKAQRVELFDGGVNRYWVSAPPIDTTATITVSVDGSALNSDDYTVYADRGIFAIEETPEKDYQNVSITYTGGYALDTVDTTLVLVPDDLKMACIEQVGYEMRTRLSKGTNTISLPNGSVSFIPDLDFTVSVKAILDKYRRRIY